MKKVEIHVLCEQFSLEESVVHRWIEADILVPADSENQQFDEEDIARVQLITNLIETYNLNDDSVALIMHLLDQIHCLHDEIKRLRER